MNRLLLLAACLGVANLALAADEPAATKGDKFYLVEITDFDDTSSVETMSSAEFKKLGDEIKLEERVFVKAVALTEKEWKTDEITKSKPFPRTGIKQRTLKMIDQANSKKAIEDKLSALEEKKAERERAKADREAKRAKDKPSKTSNRNDSKSKDDREINEKRAIDLFKRHLDTLKTEALQPKPVEKADAAKAGDPAKAADPAKAGEPAAKQ